MGRIRTGDDSYATMRQPFTGGEIRMANRNAHVLEEMTWPEVRDALPDLKVVLLPTGSTEQHGPNTSFATDTGRADGFSKRVAARMFPRALAVPPIGYGISYHHMRFPGS